MSNPADPIIRTEALEKWAIEQLTGDEFEGESIRENRVGVDREVVVNIYTRNTGPKKGTHFLRVVLRSATRPEIIKRFEVDFDRYGSESDFLQAVMVGGGVLAELLNEQYGDSWDADYVAKQAREAAVELLHDIKQQS